MTLPLATQRMTRPLLTIAAILVSIGFGVWGAERGMATVAGVTVGLGNWFAMRWLMGRLVLADSSRKGLLSLLLVAKMGLLIAIVFVLISRLALDPIGLVLGLSILFFGPVIAGLLIGTTGSTQSLDPSAASAAREER
jgi:hypothetical protein